MEAILSAIGTVGFPIVAVLALGYFVFLIWKQSVEREKVLMEEITANRLVNQKFAEIIAGYEVRLGGIESDVKDIKNVLQLSQDNN